MTALDSVFSLFCCASKDRRARFNLRSENFVKHELCQEAEFDKKVERIPPPSSSLDRLMFMGSLSISEK